MHPCLYGVPLPGPTQPPLPRRSLKLFFVLRMYGEQQIQAYLRHHIALAQYFARLVQQDERFELAVPQRFGLVCFRLKGVGRQANAELLDAVNATGRAGAQLEDVVASCKVLRWTEGTASFVH
jgi:aromatic-L-amino-acid decarboxylase